MSRRGKSDMTVRKEKLNNCHSTQSCSGLTGHPEDWRRQRDYPIKSGNDRERRTSGITARREKSR